MLIAFRSFFPHCWFYIIIAFVQVDLSRLVRMNAMTWSEAQFLLFCRQHLFLPGSHGRREKHDSWTNKPRLLHSRSTWDDLKNVVTCNDGGGRNLLFRIFVELCKSFFLSLDFTQVTMVEPYCMYNIVGVTSFGKFCGFASSYGVYTNVTSFVEFIERIVWP